MSRFVTFTRAERDALHDGLVQEAGLDADEDESFVERVEVAERLLAELEADGALLDDARGG